MKNIRIREKEIKLLISIGKHGFVDIEFIRKFIFPDLKKETIRRKLTSLSKHDFIVYTDTFIPKGFTTNNYAGYRIYALGKKGLEYTEYLGIDALDNTKTIQNSSPYRMYHQVQVATVTEVLESTFIENHFSNFQYYDCLNEKEAYNDVLQHQPDAFVIIKSKATNNFAGLFIEVERSYSTERRLRSKLLNYKSAIQSRYYDEKVGIKFVRYRILFIAQSENEYTELKRKLSELLEEIDVDVAVCRYAEFVKNSDKNIYDLPGNNHKKFNLFESE